MVYSSSENSASTVFVSYSVTDAAGRSMCSPAGVSVRLTVGTASSACTVFSSESSPYGTCSLSVGTSSFSSLLTTLSVSISLFVSSVLVQNTALDTVSLAPIPTQSNPSAVGLYFQLPIYAAVPGDAVTVQMYVNYDIICDLSSIVK